MRYYKYDEFWKKWKKDKKYFHWTGDFIDYNDIEDYGNRKDWPDDNEINIFNRYWKHHYIANEPWCYEAPKTYDEHYWEKVIWEREGIDSDKRWNRKFIAKFGGWAPWYWFGITVFSISFCYFPMACYEISNFFKDYWSHTYPVDVRYKRFDRPVVSHFAKPGKAHTWFLRSYPSRYCHVNETYRQNYGIRTLKRTRFEWLHVRYGQRIIHTSDVHPRFLWIAPVIEDMIPKRNDGFTSYRRMYYFKFGGITDIPIGKEAYLNPAFGFGGPRQFYLRKFRTNGRFITNARSFRRKRVFKHWFNKIRPFHDKSFHRFFWRNERYNDLKREYLALRFGNLFHYKHYHHVKDYMYKPFYKRYGHKKRIFRFLDYMIYLDLMNSYTPKEFYKLKNKPSLDSVVRIEHYLKLIRKPIPDYIENNIATSYHRYNNSLIRHYVFAEKLAITMSDPKQRKLIRDWAKPIDYSRYLFKKFLAMRQITECGPKFVKGYFPHTRVRGKFTPSSLDSLEGYYTDLTTRYRFKKLQEYKYMYLKGRSKWRRKMMIRQRYIAY